MIRQLVDYVNQLGGLPPIILMNLLVSCHRPDAFSYTGAVLQSRRFARLPAQRNRGKTKQAMIRPTMRQATALMFAGCIVVSGAAASAPAPAESAAEPTKPWQPLPGPDALARRKRHVIETVNAWAKAWSRQDFETYVSAYAADFPPSGRSHEIWLALRRKHIMEKASIRILIVAPEVQMLSSDRARVTFVQIYQSPKYSDQVNKALTLQQTDAGWRIARERSSPLD